MITGCPHGRWVCWCCHKLILGSLQVRARHRSRLSHFPKLQNCGTRFAVGRIMTVMITQGCSLVEWTGNVLPKNLPKWFYLGSYLGNRSKLGFWQGLNNSKKRVPHKLLKRICHHKARERNLDLFHHKRLHAIWLFFSVKSSSRTLVYRASLSQKNEDILRTNLQFPKAGLWL